MSQILQIVCGGFIQIFVGLMDTEENMKEKLTVVYNCIEIRFCFTKTPLNIGERW